MHSCVSGARVPVLDCLCVHVRAVRRSSSAVCLGPQTRKSRREALLRLGIEGEEPTIGGMALQNGRCRAIYEARDRCMHMIPTLYGRSSLQHRTRVSYQRFRKREWIATIQIRRAIEPDRTCSSISLRVIYRDLCCTKLSAQLMTLGELCANDYRCSDRGK